MKRIFSLLLLGTLFACDKPKVVRRANLVVTVDSQWTIISTDGHACVRDIKQMPLVSPGDTVVCVWGPQ